MSHKNKNQIFKDFAELYKLTDEGLNHIREARKILEGKREADKMPDECIVCGRPSQFGGFCSIAHQVDYWGE